jgi:hypothetical protein
MLGYRLVKDEEWTLLTNLVSAVSEKVNKLPTPQEFNRVRSLAEGASMICEGILPDSGIKAQSFDGAPVITGMIVKS